MTEFKGYRSPRRPEYFFLSKDWSPRELHDNFKQYREDFEDTIANLDREVNVDESFWTVGHRDTVMDLEELQKYSYAGNIDVALGEMQIEAEGVEGEIRYETHLPGEGAARIQAFFNVDDPELEEEVENYVSRHFNSFLGMDLGFNPVRSIRE